jgi:hypothetical protein
MFDRRLQRLTGHYGSVAVILSAVYYHVFAGRSDRKLAHAHLTLTEKANSFG